MNKTDRRLAAIETTLAEIEKRLSKIENEIPPDAGIIDLNFRDIARTQESNTASLLRIASTLSDQTARLMRIEAALAPKDKPTETE